MELFGVRINAAKQIVKASYRFWKNRNRSSLKGVSSRMLRKKRFPQVEDKLWGGHLWSPSYCAASYSGAPIDIVRKYIEDQRA